MKIGYVLNCAAECENKNFADIIYFQVKLNDFPNFNISSFFLLINEFINKAKLSGKNILIHCQLGISRSTTCLIAYMITVKPCLIPLTPGQSEPFFFRGE